VTGVYAVPTGAMRSSSAGFVGTFEATGTARAVVGMAGGRDAAGGNGGGTTDAASSGQASAGALPFAAVLPYSDAADCPIPP
jgi:hypothetical protein